MPLSGPTAFDRRAAPAAADGISGALAELATGRAVVLVDDVSGRDTADVVFAAQAATPTLVAATVRRTSGFLCVALPAGELTRLQLPLIGSGEPTATGSACAVTVDLVEGVGTGISARDRALTIAALADPGAAPSDFSRPGHVVPLLAADGGVLARPSRAEAALDLTRLAGLRPAAAVCELVSDDPRGELMRGAELRCFAAAHGLPTVPVSGIVAHRRDLEQQVERAAAVALPTELGGFRGIGYRGTDGAEHLAVVVGEVDPQRPVPVHVHPECLTGDVLASLACPCRRRLDEALSAMSAAGHGVLVYVRARGRLRGRCPAGPPTNTAVAEVAAHVLRDLGLHTATLIHPEPRLADVLRERRIAVLEPQAPGRRTG